MKKIVQLTLILLVVLCVSTVSATNTTDADNSILNETITDTHIVNESIPNDTVGTNGSYNTSKKIYISSDGNDDNPGTSESPKATINNAINYVSDNGEIYLNKGKYNEPTIILNKNISIIGVDRDLTRITSNNILFKISSNVLLKNFTINRVTGKKNGGAISNNGSLELENIKITSCNATYGGAIYNQGTLNIVNSTFSKNNARIGSSIYNTGNLTLNNTNFTSNHATKTGTIFSKNNFNINNCNFKNNNNTAIYIYTNNNQNIINSSKFINNTAKNGASIYNKKSKLTINKTTFKNNTATNYASIYNTGTIILTNSTFNNNSARIAGAIYSVGRVTIDECNFTNNPTTAVYIGKSNNYVNRSYFISNNGNTGGAIYVTNSTLTIEKSQFYNNSANKGAALYGFKSNSNIKYSVILDNNNDIYNSKGNISADYNWWGSNNITSDRINNITLNNWLYLSITHKNKLIPNNDIITTISLYNLYDGKNLVSISPANDTLYDIKMNIDVKGPGVSKNWSTLNQGICSFTDKFPETGIVNYTVKISFKDFMDQIKISIEEFKNQTNDTQITNQTKEDPKKITSLFIRRLANITTKDVDYWIKYDVTDVYVQTRVAQKDTIKLKEVINLCKNTNINVHAWVICLKTDNGWDYSTTQQNKVISFIKDTIKIEGVAGVCLDYVRYSGLNPKITQPTVITNFVKNINAAVKSYDKKLILSACVFAEKGGTRGSYGQDYTALSPYLDYLMPMAYKYDYKQGRTWLKEVTEYVVNRSPHAKVVTIIQTYKEVKGNTYTLSKAELEADALAVMCSGSYGYSLFRWGAIEKYPQNAELLWKNNN